MATILLVDDSTECRDLVSAAISNEHHVEWASTLAEANQMLESGREIDLVLLDINLPDGNGIDFLSRVGSKIRSKAISTIVLSGTNTIHSRIQGYALGATDYIPKPFDVAEFKVRVNNKLQAGERAGFKSVLEKGTLQLDLVRQEAFTTLLDEKKPLDLTPVEFRILLLFAQNDGDVVSREQILTSVWGGNAKVSARCVDHHICGLRKKIAPSGQRVEAIYGVGYRLDSY